jgi:CheY-like chemotaxis protein
MFQDLAPDNPHHASLKRIQDQIDSGADLIRQLLGFAQKGQYECKPLNVNSLIESSLAIFTRTHKQIVIERNLAEDIWPITADQGQTEQFLMNLFVNADRAMPKGGALTVKTKCLEFVEPGDLHPQCTPGRYVRISVSDTGAGMNQHAKERVFEPFFTTRSMGRGIGLGLAAVYGIVTSHRGFIEVISAPGQGTTFEIYLPAADKPPVPEKTGKVSKAPVQNTILIVDDEETISSVTQELLEFLGYRVLVANSGQQALEIAKDPASGIDLIILDMVMPVMGGEEAFERLRAIHPEMKMLLSSGFYKSEQIERMLQTGRAGFIQKPYRIQELSRMLENMLAQNA